MGQCLNSCVYQPQTPLQTNDLELKFLYSPKGYSIPCYFLDKKTKQVVLFSHANAECIGNIKWWVERTVFNLFEISFFMYEYTGQGLSEGTVSTNEKVLQDNIELAFNQVQFVLGYAPENVILWGRSLGSGVSVHLASKQPKMGGLIVQSGFTSIISTFINIKGFRMMGDMFRNVEKMADVHCPVLFLHAEDDRICPFNHAQHNQDQITHSRKWLISFSKGGHNDLEDENHTKFFGNIYWYLFMLDNSVRLVNHQQMYVDFEIKTGNPHLANIKNTILERKRVNRNIDEYQLNL